MNFNFFLDDIQISLKKSFAVTTLTSGSLALFFLVAQIGVDPPLFYGFSAFAVITGGLVSERVDRRRLLWLWILFGVLSTVFFALVYETFLFAFASVLLGISVGLGLPSCTAYFADCTVVEERARISGLIIIQTFAMVIVVLAIAGLLGLGFVETILLVAAVRATSFLALIMNPSTVKAEKVKQKSYRTVLTHKGFMLYLLPWLLFNVVAGLSAWWNIPSAPEYDIVRSTGFAVFYGCTALFGLLSGVFADRFGRKQPIVIGLVLLGVGFALLGITVNPLSYLIYELTLGIAWGFLLAVYLAIPGDVAFPFAKEKFYALGYIIPFILYIGLAGVPQLTGLNVPINAFSPILSIILFLAIVPVTRVAETLPRKTLEERKMRNHINKVGKLIRESKKE